jgi:Na+/melibiose symporter-like transporter
MGKRKTWVVPTQLIGSAILLYLSGTIEDLLVSKQVYFLTGLLITNTFVITCQDIAVDSWAVEILHPKHASYQSGAQAIGQRLGVILSTTFFVAFNSAEFCNTWIRSEPSDEPILSIGRYLVLWSIFQAIITIYIWLLVPEKAAHVVASADEEGEEEEEEQTIYVTQVPAILLDIMKNRNTIIFLGFMFVTCASYSIDQNMSPVYLTTDLKFPKESLSGIKIISAPANLICAVLSSYLSSEKPFRFLA